MCNVVLDGVKINSECDFHREISCLLDFGPYYGDNLDALWDRLSTDVERPVTIIWLHSELSRHALGAYFDQIIDIFERTRQQDIKFNWNEKFDYVLN
ncbi:barstar family protein [Klebsiella spallanzanii]|uniref:barstar family protein n=1 Tax=Klebsiella spallanzanii TaxID=2587528 RepID=UPI00115884C4|nr:barstar family protein [Klebsiella spallanzanii]VUT03215.1 Barstar [Klebsiella spallanzanii]